MAGRERRRPSKNQSRSIGPPARIISSSSDAGGRFSGGRTASPSATIQKGRSTPRVSENAFGYTYPSAATVDIGCSEGETIASSGYPIYSPDPNGKLPSYDSDPTEVVRLLGLGFHGDVEEQGVEEEDGDSSFSPQEIKGKEKNEGYLSIGGIRIYTEDTSSPDDEGTDETGDDDDDDSDDEESSDGSSSDDDSDVDDEVAGDYVEGMGGISELLSNARLDEVDSNVPEQGGLLPNARGSSGAIGKLGATALMNVSQGYGMKNPKSRNKGNAGVEDMDVGLLEMDDFFFMKDARTPSRKKKSVSHLSRSWPNDAGKSKNCYEPPGRKKKHRKEVIAMKRRERMINRGVDLDQINLKLKQMVINDVDIVSFQKMQSRDCSQVRRLASIYHLHSVSQGSSKKRYVTVTRTAQTCLPSPNDKLRLDKLLGSGIENEDTLLSYDKIHTRANTKTKMSRRFISTPASAPTKATKSDEASIRKKRSMMQGSTTYSERPVSFISRGIMQVDSAKKTSLDPIPSSTLENGVDNNGSSKLGAFEMHTRGFGSKMMAKMGFVEGGGLGKEGQGMARPIETTQRPKSLGLGVRFTEADERAAKGSSGNSSSRSSNIGAFEKHTKGFGSRMMSKMGFVPGTGLGKDSQGIVSPLTAVKHQKSRGLGG